MVTMDYKAQWISDVERLMQNPLVLQSLQNQELEGEKLREFGMLSVETLDKMLNSYHAAWDNTAAHHESDGLYEKIVGFASFGKEDLIVDLGCGSGNFLAALARRGYKRLIGVDLSPLALSMAYEKIAQIFPKTQCRNESFISFDPRRGFFLKGKPIMEEMDFSIPQLICDDIRTTDNLVRALYLQGVKADRTTFMLHGGYNAQGLEFFTYLFPRLFEEEKNPIFMLRKVESRQIDILKNEGTLVTAVRSGLSKNGNDQFNFFPQTKKELQQMRKALQKEYRGMHAGCLTPQRVKVVHMRQERDLIGINCDVPEFSGDYHCVLTTLQLRRK